MKSLIVVVVAALSCVAFADGLVRVTGSVR